MIQDFDQLTDKRFNNKSQMVKSGSDLQYSDLEFREDDKLTDYNKQDIYEALQDNLFEIGQKKATKKLARRHFICCMRRYQQ